MVKLVVKTEDSPVRQSKRDRKSKIHPDYVYDRGPPLAHSTQLSDGSSWFDVITTLVRKLIQAFLGTPIPFAKDSHPIDSQTALDESVLAGNDYPSSSNSPSFMTLMGDVSDYEDTIVME